MLMKAEIITAYSYSPKFRQYCVGAYVLESEHAGLPKGDTFKVLGTYAIDGDRNAATAEAISRIMRDNDRHPADMAIRNAGRVTLDQIKAMRF